MDYESLINYALEKARKMPQNQEFELKDLFGTNEWRGLGNHRGPLGTKFRKKIEKNDLGIEQVQKAARQSNKYININEEGTTK